MSEGGGRQKFKKVDGDFPACTRRENDNNEDKTRRDEHCNVDGDVTLCLRSFDEENKGSSSNKNDKERMTSGSSGSSVLNNMISDSRSKVTSGRKDSCCKNSEKSLKVKTQKKGHHVHCTTREHEINTFK